MGFFNFGGNKSSDALEKGEAAPQLMHVQLSTEKTLREALGEIEAKRGRVLKTVGDWALENPEKIEEALPGLPNGAVLLFPASFDNTDVPGLNRNVEEGGKITYRKVRVGFNDDLNGINGVYFAVYGA